MSARAAGPLVVVALGGNALVRDKQHESIPDQYETVQGVAPHLVDLVAAGWRVVVTHGNGPQVGFILRRSELAIHEVAAPVPLDYVVGDTQGAIGYMFCKAIDNELRRRGLDVPVVAIVTQSVVAADDPAFVHPSKPVGTFMDEATAQRHAAEHGWTIAEDSGRGWRRTVPSPEPVEIVELPTIRALCELGAVVVAGGGGGIAVIHDRDGALLGAEAVVDKDRTSALLAATLEADLLLVATGVEQVAVDFGTPHQRGLDELSTTEASRLLAEGQFGEGSMGPKIDAVLDFLARRPSAAAIITSPTAMRDALERRAGTRITV